ncbi:MAG TPA: hypothetical protein VFJ48_08920, partial [Casimicrobiaceae bacterium]|nr:hypothetical protein [Casimicrobiaceae bacterium]
ARSLAQHNSLSELAIDLPTWKFPVSIVTLKNRTLSPVVERFIAGAREVAKSIATRLRVRTKCKPAIQTLRS